MGIQFYTITFKTEKQFKKIMEILQLHNDEEDYGEELGYFCRGELKGQGVVICGHGGGRYRTMCFLKVHFGNSVNFYTHKDKITNTVEIYISGKLIKR